MSAGAAMRIVVVGASAAGLKAACRARRLLPRARITVLDASPDISYAACGLPYFVGGDVQEAGALSRTGFGVARDAGYFARYKDIEVRTGVEVEAVDPHRRALRASSVAGADPESIDYDELVLATGAAPRSLPGVALEPGLVAPFKTLADAVETRKALEKGAVGSVAVVGGGLLGCELAEAFGGLWGCQVTVVEAEPQLLPGLLDREMAALVEAHLEQQSVGLRLGAPVRDLRRVAQRASVLAGEEPVEADRVVVAVGVQPRAAIAESAGIRLGPRGGIAVDERLRTSVEHVWAAGDCVEVPCAVRKTPMVLPLGSLANRQGRVVGDNLAGRASVFGPVAGSVALKVFELNVAATGLTRAAANRAGLRTACVWGTFGDVAHWHPRDQRLFFEMVYEPGTERLLGLQGVGRGDVLRRVDVFANLLLRGGRLEDLLDLEMAYAPPLAAALDPLHHLGSMALAQERDGIRALAPGEPLGDAVVLDVRLESEVQAHPLGEPRVVTVSLEQLRRRLDELPPGAMVVVCEKGPRALDAVRMLAGLGREGVRYAAGGRFLRERLA